MLEDVTHNVGLVAFLSAVSTAILGWLGTQMIGRAAIQTAVNNGFKEVMDQMRLELRAALTARDKAEARNDELELEIESLKRVIAAMELRLAGGYRESTP